MTTPLAAQRTATDDLLFDGAGDLDKGCVFSPRVFCPWGDAVSAPFELRHRYFVAGRGWAAPCVERSERESDCYDPHCHHLGVFENDQLVGYLRVLPATASTGFMLDHDFRCLLTDDAYQTIIRENAIELSRLVLAPPTDPPLSASATHCRNREIMELLLKLLYQLSLRENYHHFYIEVEASWLKPFARRFGLPFAAIGEPYTFPDGTVTIAAYASLETLENAIKTQNLAKYEWYEGE